MNWLLVAVFGAVGAPTRYLVDRFVGNRTSRAFPYGTLIVNVVGSFILGVLTGLTLHQGLSPHVRTALGTGFCGALTTWSTWSFESVRLLEDGALAPVARNVIGSLAIGLVAAGAGMAVTL